MRSQWESLLQNLGEWQGSFTQVSPQGAVLEDTTTIVSLEGINDNQTVRQTLRFFRAGGVDEKVLEYSSLGRGVMFFENGAFSQGSTQWGPFSEFGAEFGLIHGDRRLRLVQLFNRESKPDKFTLIREKLGGTDTPENPQLTVEQLLGDWQGEVVTIYPDWRSPDTYPMSLKLHLEDNGRLVHQLNFGKGESSRTIASSARIDGNILHFDQSSQPVQVLLLPDGASANFPLEIKPRQPFFLEVGWLIQPDLRQRMIRSYNDKGEWVSLSLVTEHKLNQI
jgi:hypothetical protein